MFCAEWRVAVASGSGIEDAFALGYVVVGLQDDAEPLYRGVERRKRKILVGIRNHLRTVEAIVTPSGVTTSITDRTRYTEFGTIQRV